MPQVGEIDILIATDCISEGQNLQDCDYVINYDIHWNPVRIIQRFGRIDRIGSKNKEIQMVNFWPTDDLNKYINLKNRVESRMALVDLTATGEDDVLNGEQLQDPLSDDVKYRDKQNGNMVKQLKVFFINGYIPQQRQPCIFPVAFAGMYAGFDKQHCVATFTHRFRSEISVAVGYE